MAKRRTTPQRVPEAVREAVERTIQATVGSAIETRGRAQEAVDDIVRGAEAGAGAVRDRVRGAIEVGRPATYEDIRELRAELRAIVRRLDAIDARLAGTPKPKSRPKQPAARSLRATAGAKKRSS